MLWTAAMLNIFHLLFCFIVDVHHEVTREYNSSSLDLAPYEDLKV